MRCVSCFLSYSYRKNTNHFQHALRNDDENNIKEKDELIITIEILAFNKIFLLFLMSFRSVEIVVEYIFFDYA